MQGSLASIQMRIQKQQPQDTSFNCLRFKIGQQPQYISPKNHSSFTSEPQMVSESEFNSSMNVPKFHSPSMVESMALTTKTFKDKKDQLTEEFTQFQLQKQITQLAFFSYVNIIVWLCYIIGSVDFLNHSVSAFHVVDLIGNGLALIVVVFTVYTRKQISSFSQILHIWSFILTITFLAYPIKTSSSPQSDRVFIQILNILRCVRLTFPIFQKQSPLPLAKKMLQIVFKSKKIVAFILIVCFLLGFFCYQTFADSTGNRCRSNETPQALNSWDSVDDRLCGNRACPAGSYCRNVKLFGLVSINEQKLPLNIESGLYSFDSSYQAAISIFQMFTLNSWGKISQIYFDVYPAWISVPFYIMGWIMFEKLFMALIVLFYDSMKQRRQKIHLIIEGDNKKIHQNIQIAHDDIKIEFHDVTISRVQSARSLAAQKNCTENNNQDNTKQKMGIKPKAFLYCIAVVFSIIHIVLASQFALEPSKIDEDMYNRRLGVVLSVFFIFHLIALGFLKIQLSDSSEESTEDVIQTSLNTTVPQKHKYGMSMKQTRETILSLESFIFYISLADYILRLIEGKYILEEKSGLTTIAHFAIALRLYYVYLAAIDLFNFKCLKSHLATCVRTFKSIFAYFTSIIACAIVLGAISYNIDMNIYEEKKSLTGFLLEINRFLMFLINHSWQSLFRVSISEASANQEPLFLEIIGSICLVIGSMIYMRFTISNLVHQAFWQSLQADKQSEDQQSLQNNQNAQNPNENVGKTQTLQPEQDEQSFLKREKSFFIFAFENSLRQFAYSIIKSDSYEVVKFRFYLVYILTNLICCIACEPNIYGIISTVFEAFVLVDILLSSIALRFSGKYSYTQNKFSGIMHFFFALLAIFFSVTQLFQYLRQFQLHFVPFFQFMKIILILNSFESIKGTFAFIESIFKTLALHFLILIPILLGYALMMLLVLSSKDENSSFIQKITEGFKLSLIIFCQKGWDLNRIFGASSLSSQFGQLTIFAMLITWIAFGLSIFYSLAGIIISLLVKAKQTSEEQIKKQLLNKNSLLQERKIKERISKIKPKLNSTIYSSGFFIGICQNILYQCAKRFCLIGSIICFLILNTSLNTNERIAVYTAHIFFFTAQILLFAFESIVYSASQVHFIRDLILTLIAIPGSYIGFVNPVQFSTGSSELKVILLLFNALTVVRFVKIVNYFPVLQNIYTFLKDKISQTLNSFASMLVFTAATGFYIYLIFAKQQPIIQCLNYAFIGLVGGDFHSAIENLIDRNHIIFSYQIHFLYFVVNLLSIVFKNLLLAFIIYELSDLAKERMPTTITEFNLFNFNKFFHQNKFIEEWMKIDPHGKGFVNYSTIMHKTHKFIVTFSITNVPYKTYLNRVQTFRKLKIPIYEAQTTFQRGENQKPQILKEYVVTFYDFLFELARFSFMEMTSNKLMSKGEYFIENITFTDQPISIINIGEAQNYQLSKFSKKGEKQSQKLQQIKEQWRKKCYDLTKSNMNEKFEDNQQSSELNAVLRLTKITSEQLYFAYRVKSRVYKFLKKVQISNEIKRFEEINKFKKINI